MSFPTALSDFWFHTFVNCTNLTDKIGEFDEHEKRFDSGIRTAPAAAMYVVN